MQCAVCRKGVIIEDDGDNIYTAFCTPEHLKEWQDARSTEEILLETGDPTGQRNRCQWCQCRLHQGFHSPECPVRTLSKKDSKNLLIPIQKEREEFKKEKIELFKKVDAERTRALRAEKHLRECCLVLKNLLPLLSEENQAKIKSLIASRQPNSCKVKMSWYQTCKLGTYGCIETHELETPSNSERLTIPLSWIKEL